MPIRYLLQVIGHVDLLIRRGQLVYPQFVIGIGSFPFGVDVIHLVPVEIVDEVERTSAAIERITGVRPRLYRPPFGKVTARQLIRLVRLGYTTVLWDVDPKDFGATSAHDIAARLAGVEEGNVVLLHDSFPSAAAALPTILTELESRGLRIAALAS